MGGGGGVSFEFLVEVQMNLSYYSSIHIRSIKTEVKRERGRGKVSTAVYIHPLGYGRGF